MCKLERIKKERKALERMLLSKQGDSAASEAYKALRPYFDKVDNMNSYYPIGRIRLARLFLESDLSNDKGVITESGV